MKTLWNFDGVIRPFLWQSDHFDLFWQCYFLRNKICLLLRETNWENSVVLLFPFSVKFFCGNSNKVGAILVRLPLKDSFPPTLHRNNRFCDILQWYYRVFGVYLMSISDVYFFTFLTSLVKNQEIFFYLQYFFLLLPSFVYWAMSKEISFIPFGAVSTLQPNGAFQIHNLLAEVSFVRLKLTREKNIVARWLQVPSKPTIHVQ